MDMSHLKYKEKNKKKKQNRISKNCGAHFKRCNICLVKIQKDKKKKNRGEKII